MKNWWKGLSTIWKVVVIAGLFILAVLVYDAFTGGLSDLKGYIFDKQSAAREQENQKLTTENEELRKKWKEFETKAMEAESKNAIYEADDAKLSQKTKDEVAKLEDIQAELDKQEAETAQPIDAYTRCVRTKNKMLSMHPPSKAAQEMNCDDYKQQN